MFSTLSINRAAMKSALSVDMLATDIAYYLVRRKVSDLLDVKLAAGECVCVFC